MLLRVILKNILSYREETQFDMFPNPKRVQLNSHVMAADVNTLKMAAIYGGNGSGKSNLIYAMDFIKQFAINDSFIDTTDITQYLHALSDGNKSASFSILVEFSIFKKYYIYEIEISKDGTILKESLKQSGLGKKRHTAIFDRERNSIKFQQNPKTNLKNAIDKLLENNSKSSILSLNQRFPILDVEDMKNVYTWFEDHLQIVPLKGDIKYIISLMHQNKDLLEFTQQTLKSIDLGISDIRTHEETLDDFYLSHPQIQKEWDKSFIQEKASEKYGLTTFRSSKPFFDIVVDNGLKKVREMVVSQLGENGKEYEMGIESQSDGTIRLLMLMPLFYDLFNMDITYFVDEINYPIHPLLIKALIRSFSSNPNTRGQLIFTTHEVEILERDIIRPDEIWITEKKDGNTMLYSVNDFKIHKNLALKSSYMEGRFGGVPYIEHLIEQWN